MGARAHRRIDPLICCFAFVALVVVCGWLVVEYPENSVSFLHRTPGNGNLGLVRSVCHLLNPRNPFYAYYRDAVPSANANASASACCLSLGPGFTLPQAYVSNVNAFAAAGGFRALVLRIQRGCTPQARRSQDPFAALLDPVWRGILPAASASASAGHAQQQQDCDWVAALERESQGQNQSLVVGAGAGADVPDPSAVAASQVPRLSLRVARLFLEPFRVVPISR